MGGTWGLLGPQSLPNTRRTRTLGLGVSIRRFNDLAVPGLGGIWYGKQLLLATLGVAVAESARKQGMKVQNIEVANAIEALACWLAFKANNWSPDARLRGRTKLQRKQDFGFRSARQRNFHVTQPMRMLSVQALPALGFVESESARFNAFRCSEPGLAFAETALDQFHPFRRSVLAHLTCWVQGKDDRVDTDALRSALSPVEPLDEEALPLLSERLIQGGKNSVEQRRRRKNALNWVDSLRINKRGTTNWGSRPSQIDENHWRDLQAGALFFEVRDAAIAVLDAMEVHMANQGAGQFLVLNKTEPESLNQPLASLQSAAVEYLKFKHPDTDASAFCSQCAGRQHMDVLRALVIRDGHVLRLSGDTVKPGPAFRGRVGQASTEDEDSPTQQRTALALPEGISYRVQNLYLLNLDLHGELESWLKQQSDGANA